MVREIDYLNGRIRGMMGRLMSEEQLHQLTDSANIRQWMALLRETPYSGELGGSIALKDSDALLAAIDRSTASRTHKMSRIASGPPAGALKALLAEWDLRNLLTLISGIHHRSRPVEILSSTIAGGLLAQDQLETLVHSSTLKEAADRLATWNYTYRHAFKRAIRRADSRPLVEMRLDLTRGFMDQILSTVQRSGYPLLIQYVGDRVDQMNLMTALMWRTLPTDRDPEEFFIEGPGRLTRPVYLRVMKSGDGDEIAQALPRGILKTAISKVAILFELEGRTSVFLQALDREIYLAYTRPRNVDPLDISLLLAYMLALHREGVLIKLALVRILLDVPMDTFREVVGDV
jgi:vacuolar-type H+-ATPase subunit C/Vma6